MRKSVNRLFSLLLAAWMLAAPILPARAADGDTVTISSAADLQRFAKNCALDTWSQGKTVTLAADLDLSGVDFTPIPTFGGTFLGRGHTISGLSLTAAGSTQGLFRYVQPGGLVRDLTVKGTVAPGGTRSIVGGIAGDNAGTLQNCFFRGAVLGESSVGGIAGQNSVTGEIIGCSVSGSVSGESITGGIAGRNLGLLLKCTSAAGVNLTQTENGVDLTGPDAGAALEELAAADDETYHLLGGCFDTGGIVGYSSGVVQSCANSGPVGYPHVGYNTGGIAGRQNGYLAGCVNTGTIHGRKDVGGIVGQAEPYVLVDPGQDTLEQLRQELNTLENLINRALDDAERTGNTVSARLTAMGDYAGGAKDSTRELLDRVSDFTDENIETVNTLTADITGALDKISPALDDLSEVGWRLERMSRQLGDAMDSLGGAVDTGDQIVDDLRAAVGSLRQSSADLTAAVNRLENALEAFRGFVDLENWSISWADLAAARSELSQAFSALREAGNDLDDALSQLQRALSRSDALSYHLGGALEDLEDASNSAAAIGRLLRRALDTIGDAVDDLTANGPAEFTPLGEEFRQSGDSLYESLNSLFDEMEGLNSALQSGNATLTADLRAINRQCDVVFDLLLDTLSDLMDDVEEGLDSVIQDTSEEDIAATREGKVADCSNTGVVDGDRNVGGVVGAMAIEFDLDPEDDGADRFSFGSSYETKAVLMNCLNRGAVTAKKDCAGGLAGRMDLGTALDCQNYGPVTSTGGGYVGGVAGYADASIRSCYAKSSLSGGSYIGGVAGWASRLRDSCAIATIEGGEESLGAIAGGVETGGVLSGNRFVDTGAAGVDGVSYAGRAEPISFEELSQLPDVPLEFTAFTLTLTAEGKTVAQLPFLYGDDLSRIDLPAVPEREDSYGSWPDFDTSGLNSDITLEAVYTPWVTLVASDGKVNKLSIALAEGRFTEEVELLVEGGGVAPPQEAGERDEIWAEAWEITLVGADLGPEETVPLRLLNPSGGDALVWRYENGQWRQVEAVRNGQYLLLTMTGAQGIFYVQPQGGNSWVLIAAAAAVVALLIMLFIVIGVHRKKKKAVRAAKAQAEEKRKEQK